MLLLSFVAVALGCLMLSLELFTRRLPLVPPPELKSVGTPAS